MADFHVCQRWDGCPGNDGSTCAACVANIRDAVSLLRSQLQIARIFVEGKALTPDNNVLLAFDLVLKQTKKHERR